jgi:hypothetical protein
MTFLVTTARNSIGIWEQIITSIWGAIMFTKVTHAGGIESDVEILFSTPFDYFFPDAARSAPCLLPAAESTVTALKKLGVLMADPGTETNPQPSFDSSIPAIFTYLGQFIDHDITARTDRDGTLSALGMGDAITPLDPDAVVSTLKNGRRPQLDMDNLFGDAPALAGSAVAARSESQTLYDGDFKLRVFEAPGRRDVPRDATRTAIIADMRNDENLNVSQLHAAVLKFYNAVYAAQPMSTAKQRYVRARQLVRWAYQYVVAYEYLMEVCDPSVALDTLANGPRFIGAMSARGDAFMPLEFSVAGFRFAHSMIRPFYKLNATTTLTTDQVLGPSGQAANFPTTGADQNQLDASRLIDFQNFAGTGPNVQKARKIDTKIAQGLFTLPLAGRSGDPVLANLARSNLLRGYNLSIPTGQAVCDGFDVDPLTVKEIHDGERPEIVQLLTDTYFDQRTPLWYLRAARGGGSAERRAAGRGRQPAGRGNARRSAQAGSGQLLPQFPGPGGDAEWHRG